MKAFQVPARPKPSQKASKPKRPPVGLAARELAVRLLSGVLLDKRPLEQVLAEASAAPRFASLEPRDRALARAVAATALRRQGELEHVLGAFLERPLPADRGRLWPILLAGAAQLVCLDMPAHAVVDIAVETTRRDRSAHRFAKLVNAVLRRVAEHGTRLLAAQDGVRLNIPDWLWQSWEAAYGAEATRRIAEASLREAPLDISAKSDAAGWAARLGGRLLPTGSIRLPAHGRIEDLAGYAEGAWWVQDAGAALVARVAGDVAGLDVADLCAAPGGKTAALAAAGARVTAVDISPARLQRLRDNLRRLSLAAEIVEADAATWSPDLTFDAVVLDAPCTATGTIRRHPDILRLKTPDDIPRMADLQARMLTNAATLVRPGGLLIYSTCSLQPEEAEHRTASFLATHPHFHPAPITPTDLPADPTWLTPTGTLRTLPFHLQLDPATLSGIDAFHVSRLRRQA